MDEPGEARQHDWDSAYRRGETPWDKGAPAPPLLEYLEREPLAGRVLVPGCGIGHDARAIADAGAGEVVGVDISVRAVARARETHGGAGLAFELGDFLDLPERHVGAFDWVFEHTCISGLHPSLLPAYAESVVAALRPGGRYLAIFFIQPWDDGETPEPPPYGITRQEIDALFAGKLRTDEEWLPTRHYPGREGRELVRLMGTL